MVKGKVQKLSNDILDKVAKFVAIFSNFSNLKKRIISSVVLVPIAIYGIFFSLNLFIILVATMTILMSFEWIDLVRSAKNQAKWRFIGFIYILIPVLAVIKLRSIDTNILLWMFCIIWTTDIFAYFAGRNLGGPKLAPSISPSKTWSGLFGAIVGSVLIGFLSSFMFVEGNIAFFMAISGILAIISQSSDLMESKFKRMFKIKDSGNVIPGHGGVLDRMDSLILVAPITMLIVCAYLDKFILL